MLVFLSLLTLLLLHEVSKCQLVLACSILRESFFDVKLLLSFAQLLDPLVIHCKFRVVHHSVVKVNESHRDPVLRELIQAFAKVALLLSLIELLEH